MASNRISISNLAGMVKRSLDEMQGELRDLREQIKDVRAQTNHRIDAVEYQQGSRLDRLEDEMRVVKAKLN